MSRHVPNSAGTISCRWSLRHLDFFFPSYNTLLIYIPNYISPSTLLLILFRDKMCLGNPDFYFSTIVHGEKRKRCDEKC